MPDTWLVAWGLEKMEDEQENKVLKVLLLRFNHPTIRIKKSCFQLYSYCLLRMPCLFSLFRLCSHVHIC